MLITHYSLLTTTTSYLLLLLLTTHCADSDRAAVAADAVATEWTADTSLNGSAFWLVRDAELFDYRRKLHVNAAAVRPIDSGEWDAGGLDAGAVEWDEMGYEGAEVAVAVGIGVGVGASDGASVGVGIRVGLGVGADRGQTRNGGRSKGRGGRSRGEGRGRCESWWREEGWGWLGWGAVK